MMQVIMTMEEYENMKKDIEFLRSRYTTILHELMEANDKLNRVFEYGSDEQASSPNGTGEAQE